MSEETVTGDARAEALDVDAIGARYEATTPGAWDYITQGIVGLRSQSSEDAVSHPLFQAYKSEEDGVFVAHAHQDVPALIGEIERLTAQLQATQQNLAAVLTRGPEWLRARAASIEQTEADRG